MRKLSSAIVAGFVAASLAPALAQDVYPTRPLRFVVGYSPGGQSDVLGLIIARGLTQELGKQAADLRKQAVRGVALAFGKNGHLLLLGGRCPDRDEGG